MNEIITQITQFYNQYLKPLLIYNPFVSFILFLWFEEIDSTQDTHKDLDLVIDLLLKFYCYIVIIELI